MFKNPAARKLSLYFGAALLVFAVILSSMFILLFRSQTISMHKTEMENRANSIAQKISGYMDRGTHMGGYGAYLRSISDIAGADAWVVGRDMQIITAGGYGGMGMGMGEKNEPVKYSELPENAEEIVLKVFADQTVFSEDFSSLLDEPALTVGVPIHSETGEVLGAVLLHSPVKGTNQVIQSGMGILVISLVSGMVLSLLLSLLLSKNFTDPIVLKQAQDAVRLEQIRRDYVANISHELKTPITVIRGSLEALNDKVVTSPEKVDEYHRQMLVEVIGLQRLVGDLLDLSRLQNADFVIEKQNLSLTELVNDALRSVGPMASDKKMTINLKQDREYVLWGDYGRLRQMLVIILDNGIKFSPEGTDIDVNVENGRILIRDYGTGIPRQDQPFIFERFYKGSTQNTHGTGLGLAIAKQIADRHGIDLKLDTEAVKGACFVMDINKNEITAKKQSKDIIKT